jgi:hypothetical protein
MPVSLSRVIGTSGRSSRLTSESTPAPRLVTILRLGNRAKKPAGGFQTSA